MCSYAIRMSLVCGFTMNLLHLHLIWALVNLQNMPIYYASGKYKLSICSFSPLKKMFGWRMIQMCKIFFSLEFNGEHKTRSSRPEVFCKKGVLRNVTKFTGKHLCQSLFFNKLQTQGLQPYSTRDFGTGIFLRILWNFKEHLFYRTPLVAASSFIFSIKLFLLNTPWWITDWLTRQAFMHS